MTQNIDFPSVTDIYRALITPNGPRAYVPKLSKAINKMIDEPTKDNLARAKKITKNPIIQQTIDAIYTATKSSRYDDDIMDIQYGIIATLVDNEYTQLPWLVDKIKDDEVQYQVLNNYREKYAGIGYAQQYYAQPINQRTDKDYLSKCIIEIYLSLIMHPKTPTARKDGEHRAIYHIADEFISKIQQNPHLRKEVATSYQEIFDRIEKVITKAMKTPQSAYNRESEYALMARRLTAFIPDKTEAKRLHDHFKNLEQKCMFPHLFGDEQKSQEVPDEQPTPEGDAYDKLIKEIQQVKSELGKEIDKLIDKAKKISQKPKVKKAKQTVETALDAAARATVNAIDDGIKKIKKKATRKNFNAAIDTVKRKWDEFVAQIEGSKTKTTNN